MDPVKARIAIQLCMNAIITLAIKRAEKYIKERNSQNCIAQQYVDAYNL